MFTSYSWVWGLGLLWSMVDAQWLSFGETGCSFPGRHQLKVYSCSGEVFMSTQSILSGLNIHRTCRSLCVFMCQSCPWSLPPSLYLQNKEHYLYLCLYVISDNAVCQQGKRLEISEG